MRTIEQSERISIIESFKALFKEKMAKPNMFIMPYISSDDQISIQFDKIVSLLKENFEVTIYELSPESRNLPFFKKLPDNLRFKCIAVDSAKTETIRDILKEMLWPTNNEGGEAPTLSAVLNRSQDITAKNFNLSEYGIFIPYRIQKFGSIRTHSFNHKPVFYRYRLALNKIEQLPSKLQSYLNLLFSNCPNHLFLKSEFRASAQTCDNLKIQASAEHLQESHLIRLAGESNYFNEYKSKHENLQKYFLLNDPCTIASEIPLWLEAQELKDYSSIFNTEDVLTGHVDILRYEKDKKIGIWDYKPQALEETDALIQVFLYAIMLCIRTGISLQNIKCGYFDEKDAFSFDPTTVTFCAL